MVLLAGCREHYGDSSASVEQSRRRGILVAEYAVPANANFGDYRPIEIWVETVAPSGEQQIIVRLAGPHHGRQPRVRLTGFDETQYRGIRSERDGPPYERWAAPSPLPDILRLERNGKTVEIQKKTQ
jgi:hypothetical protein